MSSAAERAQETGPLAQEDARALTRLLQRSLGHGFRLVVIEVATPRLRKRIVEWLGAEIEPLGGELIDLDVRSLPGENLWSELDERLDHGTVDRQRVVLTLHGFQEAARGQPDEKAGLYRQLNVQRDLFVRDVGCFWVVLIDPYGSRKLQDIAPDFCDFASLWIRAPGEAGELGITVESRPPITPDVGRSIELNMDDSGPGLLRRAHEAVEAGQYVVARDLLTRFELDPDDKYLTAALLIRGRLELLRGDLDAARSTSEQALATSLARGDQAKIQTITALRLRGAVLLAQGQYQEARSSLERALEIHQELHGAPDPLSGVLLSELGRVHQALGETEEALRLFERAVEHAQGESRTFLATLLRGDPDEARHTLEQKLETQREALGNAPHPDVAAIHHSLALVLRAQGDLDAARRNMERSLEIRTAILGTDRHPDVVAALHDLAGILRDQGDLDGARQILQRSFEIAVQVYGTKLHPEVGATHVALAHVLGDQGDFAGAREQLERALEIHEELFGAALPNRAVPVLFALAMVLGEQGELVEAAATLERVLSETTRVRGPDHVSTCMAEVALARFLLHQGDPARAEALLQHARPILADALGLSHASVQQADRLLEACSRTPPA